MMHQSSGLRLFVVLFAGSCISLSVSKVSAGEVVHTADFTLEERALLDIKNPGYLNVVRNPSSHESHLLVSSFQLFGSDHVFSVTNWKAGLTSAAELKTSILTKAVTWPNEARLAEKELFSEPGVLISGGFLVPGRATGAITFIPWHAPEKPLALTEPKKGWFYHRTESWDVNGDGHLDIITARAHKPVIGAHKGELLWLENPGSTFKTWKEHVIGEGPDVHFRVLPSSISMPLTIISTEFSGKKLSAYRQTPQGDFTYKVLDDTLGSAFDVQVDDLNSDGQLDLLVTNHEADSKASVYGYEFDPTTLEIKARHTLLTGIETRQKGIKSASPGPVAAFFPTKENGTTTIKPWILVSGDGSQRAHILVPTHSTDTTNWNYSEYTLWNPPSTVGQSALGDIDGDGRMEIFVPAYDASKVAIFTITPKQTQRPVRN